MNMQNCFRYDLLEWLYSSPNLFNFAELYSLDKDSVWGFWWEDLFDRQDVTPLTFYTCWYPGEFYEMLKPLLINTSPQERN